MLTTPSSSIQRGVVTCSTLRGVVGDKGEGLGKYEFPRPSTVRTEVLIDALAEAIA